MAASLANVPDGIKQSFLEGIADFLWREAGLLAAIQGAAGSVEGAELFTLDLDGILLDGPQAAHPVGWRVFLETGIETVAGDVTRLRTGDEVKLRSVYRGEEVRQALESIRALCKGLADAGNYDLRLLRVPGIATEACWLKSLVDGQDLYYPIVSGATEFQPGLFSLEEFSAIAKEAAARFQRFDALPH